MLLELTVDRIALIEHLNLKLEQGLNVFTGETGAGKSILLDAIGLLLGDRASLDLIRSGADMAFTEALFAIDESNRAQVTFLLEQWGIAPAEELIIGRELHRSGRSVCRINGRMATVQMLRELGAVLVQQHGQNDQQGLMRVEEQLRSLDLYGNYNALLQHVERAYKAWKDVERQWQAAHLNEQEKVRRVDMLTFQIDEIEQVQLRLGEDEELRAERAKLQHSDKIANAVQLALEAIGGGREEQGATIALGYAIEALRPIHAYDTAISDMMGLLETAYVHADESVHALQKYFEHIDVDPGHLEQLESRLIEIRAMQRKYGETTEQVLTYQEQARKELNELQQYEDKLQSLYKEMQNRRQELADLAMQLHERRVAAASQLSKEVEEILHTLNMKHASLQIAVELNKDATGELEFTVHGADSIQFLFSANKGEAPKPLQKVASGGELSRTLLALKSVLADVDDVDTLIFDEIDVGVSGQAAQKIALQMQNLGKRHQVLCVTHSPQIGAAAHQHYIIEKLERETDTTTLVRQLNEAGRIAEIGRLIGSGLSDETAVQHAKAMLRGFQSNPV